MPPKGTKKMSATAEATKPAATEPEPTRVVVLFEEEELKTLDALVDRLNAQAKEKREARRYNRSTVIREAVALFDAGTASKPRKA